MVQRGEQGIVFICRHVAAEPIKEFQGHCFNELPVSVTTQEGPITLYLKPITRILSDTPTVVDCSDELPVKFAIDKTSSICQTKRGLSICNSSTTVDPALGLDAKLETLDSSQSHIGSTSLLMDIQTIVMNFMSRANFRAALEAAVTYNVKKCKDSLYCNAAFYQPMPYRRELLRRTAGFMNLILDSGIWQFLGFVNVPMQ